MTDRIDQYVRQVVDSAPPLSPAQRDRLRILFAGDVDAKTKRQQRGSSLDDKVAALHRKLLPP